jgi:predicted ATPase/class 3 adenylate cyclase
LVDVIENDDLSGEHRRVAVAFVSVLGLDELTVDAAVARVAAVADAVDDAVDTFGVCWTACDVLRDGATFLLFTGAPVARDDDVERLLRASRSIVEVTTELDVRIGLNAGPAFIGPIGPAARRTLAIIGDTVNLAARLKGLAGRGQVIASQAALDASRTPFETVERAPVHVKGKSRPVAHAEVGPPLASVRRHRGDELPLVGREGVLATLAQHSSAGGLRVDVVGEAGSGKSRLIDALEQELGLTVVRGGTDPFASLVPFHPLVGPMRTLIGAARDAAADEVIDHLRSALRSIEADDALWPLVAPVLGVEAADNDVTALIDDEYRRGRLHQLVAEIIAAAPCVVVVEDVHWCDEATRALLQHVATDERCNLVVTRRPEGDDVTEVRIDLEPLHPSALRSLGDLVRGDAPIPDHVLDALVQTCGGNPLYLRELVLAEIDGVDGPTPTVESVIASRIDRLPRHQRDLLRSLSVAGPECAVELAAVALGSDELDTPTAWSELDDFVRGVTEDDDRSLLRFRHDLYRSVAYAALPVSRRRSLHAAFARAIAASDAIAEDAVRAASLAHHHHAAAQWSEALHWSRQVAARASESNAWGEIRLALEKSRDAARHLGLADEEFVDLLTELGDAQERSGAFDDAESSYRAARSRSTDPTRLTELDVRRAIVATRTGSFDRTVRLAARALRQPDPTLVVRGRLARALARAQQGRFADAERELEPCARLAAEIGDDRLLAQVLLQSEMVASALDRPDARTIAVEAENLLVELGDDVRLSHLLSNSAFEAFVRGEWSDAAARLDRAVAALLRCGDLDGAGTAANNQAEILVEQGRYTEAGDRFRTAWRLLRSCRNRWGDPNIHSGLGRLAVRQGALEEGRDLLATARDEYAAMDAPAFVVDTDVRLAELLNAEDRGQEALELLAAISGPVATHGDGLLALSAARQRAVALWLCGRADEAMTALDDVRRDAVAQDAPFDSLCCDEIERVWQGLEDLPPDSADRCRRMGIVRLPPVPVGRQRAGSVR